MPSVSAKLEKQASIEASDPVKQIVTVLEKKVRNLEKRKGKLDGYRSELNKGKELNDDQLNAIRKYEQVLEVLDLTKELQKNFHTIIQDAAKHQKKMAKREQLERQQQDMQRIKDILLCQDILNRMDTDGVRSDFIAGSNGAITLTEDDLNNIDELYKLLSPERGSEEEVIPFEEQLNTCSEHMLCLIEGKNKEILGTTYKNLKDLLLRISESGYFDHTAINGSGYFIHKTEEAVQESEENQENINPEEYKSGQTSNNVGETYPGLELRTEVLGENHQVQHDHPQQEVKTGDASGQVVYLTDTTPVPPTKPLPEVLSGQGNFNFLQESQIDLESPHMDPAVVAAHPMAPAQTMVYHPSQYPAGTTALHTLDNHQAQSHIPQDENAAMIQVTQLQHGQVGQVFLSEIDPSQPIPTQTFTNQNYPSIQNVLHPAGGASAYSAYVPVTLTHEQQAARMAMAPHNLSASTTLSPSLTTEPSSLKHPGLISNVSSQQDTKNLYSHIDDYKTTSVGEDHLEESQFLSTGETQETPNYSQLQSSNFGQSRGNFSRGSQRGRGRGSSVNGFSRNSGSGRGNYASGRGGYQGYYGNRENHGSSIRRGGGRQRVRGGQSARGNPRGGFMSRDHGNLFRNCGTITTTLCQNFTPRIY
ncbi:caprin-1-like isoform X3 [Tachypleus tridentatus]|uniref:caprin-1-like isoform X3 n=1 Tax=Tachypleus tridentatus TaxID=6853 RepID=UPI003FD600FF